MKIPLIKTSLALLCAALCSHAAYAVDADGDHMDDDWEIQYFGDTSRNGLNDDDNDLIIDVAEYLGGTDPTVANTGPSLPDSTYAGTQTIAGDGPAYSNVSIYGGYPMPSDTGFDVKQDAAGNVYIAGWFKGSADLDPTAGVDMRSSAGVSGAGANENAYITKLNADGSYAWSWTPTLVDVISNSAGATVGFSRAYSLAVDASGNVYVVGTAAGQVEFGTGSSVTTGFDANNFAYIAMFVTKLNSDGTMAWTDVTGGDNGGGALGTFNYNGDSYRYDLAMAGDKLFITGSFRGSVDFDPSAAQDIRTSTADAVFVSELDSSGAYGWTRTGLPGSGAAYAHSITADAQNVYVTGSFWGDVNFDGVALDNGQATYNLRSGFIAKWPSSGDATSGGAWQVGGSAGVYVDPWGIKANGSTLYVTGEFQGSEDFDPDPTTTADFQSEPSSRDVFLLSLTTDMSYRWLQHYGNIGWADKDPVTGYYTQTSKGMNIAVNGDRVYVAGNFSGLVDFDPSATVDSRSCIEPGYEETHCPFVSEFQNDGTYLGAWTPLGGYSDRQSWTSQEPFFKAGGRAYGVSVQNGSLYVTGTFINRLNFDPTAMDAHATAAGQGEDMFLTKLQVPDPTAIDADVIVCPVGCDYDTIQAGLDAAPYGGKVAVKAGTYHESIVLSYNRTLFSVSGPKNTIIDATGLGNRVVSMYYTSTLDGFTITGGEASQGAGIYAGGNATILNNIISGNNASSVGGGVFSRSYVRVVIRGNTISQNSATYSGAIGYSSYSTVVIEGNRLLDNTAEKGGALSLGGYTSLTFNGNVLDGNHATQGGALYAGGYSGARILNSVISNNTADQGPAIYASPYSYAYLVNNTIVGNSATDGAVIQVGGSYNYLRIINSIIWNNPGVQLNYLRYGPVTFYNCISEELPGVHADPLFADAANGDYHLTTGSPAIDTGRDPASLYITVVDDIEGNPRPLDGDGLGAGTTGDGSDFDIGAYEFK